MGGGGVELSAALNWSGSPVAPAGPRPPGAVMAFRSPFTRHAAPQQIMRGRTMDFHFRPCGRCTASSFFFFIFFFYPRPPPLSFAGLSFAPRLKPRLGKIDEQPTFGVLLFVSRTSDAASPPHS